MLGPITVRPFPGPLPVRGGARSSEPPAEPPESAAPGSRTPGKPPEGGPADRTRRWSKGAARVLKALRKVPKFYTYVPGLLKFAVVEGLVTALQLTAGVTGFAGMFGMGLAGALEIAQGVREKDSVKVVGGAGEMTRGFTLGAVSAAEFAHLGPHQATAAAAAQGLTAVHSALTLTSAILKIRRGMAQGDQRLKVEGGMEIGVAAAMGVAAAGVAPGPMLGVAVALNGARFVFVHQDRLKEKGQAVIRRVDQLWDRFTDIFRDEDDEPKGAG